jgi:membrane-associated phospholipid phosphatase
LADVDHAIFGTDPWRLFRSEMLRAIHAQAYVSWFPITFGTMAVLAFSRKDHSALFDSYLATLVIGGTMGEHLLPSAGPIFYERLGLGSRFAELVATNDPTYAQFADYLWKYYQAGGAGLGTGISAMPSMHVALAVWTLFAAYRIWKPLAVPAFLYVLVIWSASIASGWHYATDGLVGALLACAAQWAATRQWRKPVDAEILQAEPAPATA